MNSRVKVLLVDDLKENLLALEGLLGRDDVEIIKAKSGTEALDLLMAHEFALALIDVQMPGMSGFELAEFMRGTNKTKKVPIIFVSATAKNPNFSFKGYERGAVDFLLKPLDTHAVKSKVNIFIELFLQKKELKTQLETITRNQSELDAKAAELEKLNAALCQVNSKLELSLREVRLLNDDLEQFAFIASHDLKEPLRTIHSFLQLLQRKNEGKFDPESVEYLQFALGGASRMTQLISDLLEYASAGMSPFKPQSVDCNEVLESAIQNLALLIAETKSEIVKEPLPTVLGDKTQLIQLFQNLLTNAIKFRGDKSPTIRVAGTSLEKEWVLAVSDNGMGIPKDAQKRIFVLFQRLNTRSEIDGSGIGLAVCKRIVERHGGRIRVESELGKGSTFHFAISNSGPSLVEGVAGASGEMKIEEIGGTLWEEPQVTDPHFESDQENP